VVSNFRQRIGFVGDMIEGQGYVPEIHDLQYQYGDAMGAEMLMHSMEYVLEQKIDLLCPGHGALIQDPNKAGAKLIGHCGDYVWRCITKSHHIPRNCLSG